MLADCWSIIFIFKLAKNSNMIIEPSYLTKVQKLVFSLSFFFLSFITPNSIFAQSLLIEGQRFDSQLMGTSVNYAVYLPAGYETSKRYYPVVYLLHGYTDDETGWVQFGEIQHYADKAIERGDITSMIIIMPDAGVTWYVNDASGKVPFEDMIIKEFIPAIEDKYRIRKKKEFRGIAGLSMGGYGTMLYAMKHPDLFVACAPLSAAFYTEETVVAYEQARWDRVEAVMYGKGLEGQDRITDHWKANNPFYIAKAKGAEELKKVKYYIDCGDDDFLYKGNSAMHVMLRDMGVPHEFRIRDGAHNWTYWRTGITDALKFISNNFHR